MKTTIENFVGVFEDALSPAFCQKAINYFNSLERNGFGITRQQHEKTSKLDKDGTTVFVSHDTIVNLNESQVLTEEFNRVFWTTCYPEYVDKYGALAEASDPHRIYHMKIQKTQVGQGYHVWHYESATRETSPRVLVYCAYLNDVNEGGETEFLYYPRRIAPKQGTIAIFPGSFTHTHRGNPPISNEKYLLNGWVEF